MEEQVEKNSSQNHPVVMSGSCEPRRVYSPVEDKWRRQPVQMNEQMEEQVEKNSSLHYGMPAPKCGRLEPYFPYERKRPVRPVEMSEQMEEQKDKDVSLYNGIMEGPMPTTCEPYVHKHKMPDLGGNLNEPSTSKVCLEWIVMVSLSPLAFLLLTLMALYKLFRFFYKVTLLFIIVAINTPFAVMFNLSVVVQYHLARFQKPQNSTYQSWLLDLACFRKSNNFTPWSWSDPRANIAIEVKLIVSDFFKVVAGDLLLGMSTNIITYFTAPRRVFYISTSIWLGAVLHKWLNTNCLSKTALSCLCDNYGLSPMTFLFSFIGFFDIGCHPIAKCSFLAQRAFLFERDVPSQANKEMSQCLLPTSNQVNPNHRIFLVEESPKERNVEQRQSKRNEEGDRKRVSKLSNQLGGSKTNEIDVERGDKNPSKEVYWYPFNGEIPKKMVIEFLEWNAFERGLFKLYPRIDCIEEEHGKYILKSFMVLKLCEVQLCEYPVERLELPEDYFKPNELFNFLDLLSSLDGFVTNKMKGRYEQSLTLSQIVEGVEENIGCKIVNPIDKKFVVAGYTNLE